MGTSFIFHAHVRQRRNHSMLLCLGLLGKRSAKKLCTGTRCSLGTKHLRPPTPNRPNLPPSADMPRLQPAFFHPRCHTIDTFPPTLPSLRPNPYSRRLADRPCLGRCHKHAPPRKAPAGPRSSRRSQPLASQASVWSAPLFRKDFTVYSLIQDSLVCFPCLLSFYLRPSALHSTITPPFAIAIVLVAYLSLSKEANNPQLPASLFRSRRAFSISFRFHGIAASVLFSFLPFELTSVDSPPMLQYASLRGEIVRHIGIRYSYIK